MSYTPIMIADQAGNVGQSQFSGMQKFIDPRLTIGLGAFSRQGDKKKNKNAFQSTIRSMAAQGPMMFPSLLR